MIDSPSAGVPVALVTGGSRGIGAAAARRLAADGTHVVVNFLSEQAMAAAVVAEIVAAGGSAESMQADIAMETEVRAMVRNVKRAHGRIDVLVNNAGVVADGFAAMMGAQKWSKVIDINLSGAFFCCREVGKVMLDSGRGSIVNVASIAGLVGTAGQANYSAAKAGLIGLTRALAGEFGVRGIRVNAVVPGFVETDMITRMPPGELEHQLTHVPLGRPGTPAEIAEAIAWIAGDRASYVNGATLVIDGGLTRR